MNRVIVVGHGSEMLLFTAGSQDDVIVAPDIARLDLPPGQRLRVLTCPPDLVLSSQGNLDVALACLGRATLVRGHARFGSVDSAGPLRIGGDMVLRNSAVIGGDLVVAGNLVVQGRLFVNGTLDARGIIGGAGSIQALACVDRTRDS